MTAANGSGDAQAGFSLLEALAAIALIALAFTPLLALQSQLTRTAIAIERAELAARHERNAVAYLSAINPMLWPEGEDSLGEATLRWRAEPVSQAVPALDPAGSPGRFEIQLFDVEARILDDRGEERVVTVRLVGWRPLGPFEQGVF